MGFGDKKKKVPTLPDNQTLIQAGIDPYTRLPSRVVNNKDQIDLKPGIKHIIDIIDEQDAVNRYVWYNLPNNITSQELERLLYLKGQLCFFYYKSLKQFYFMPYVLDGTIDFYGRYNIIHPVPMTSGVDDNVDKPNQGEQNSILSSLKLNVIYGIKDIKELSEEEIDNLVENSCVLLHDYSKELSQNTVPRVQLNEALRDAEANMIPFMNTKLMLSTGVRGVRVNDADQSASVIMEGFKIENHALNGMPWVPFTSSLDFQELALQSGGQAQDYLLGLQALDNLRLSTYGIDNGGLFEKKAHELQSESDMNGGPVGLVLQDGLSIRQNFCNIVNSLYDLDIWCEPAENIQGVDRNGDGVIYDENEGGENSGLEVNNNDMDV